MSRTTKDILFSENAIAKIKGILKQEQNPNALFRIKVEGGGCSGFQYKFDIDHNPHDTQNTRKSTDIEYGDDDLFDTDDENEGDYIVTDADGIQFAIVDPTSFNYLQNCTIDYVENLTKSDFVITNPQAKAKCGCGNSFAV